MSFEPWDTFYAIFGNSEMIGSHFDFIDFSMKNSGLPRVYVYTNTKHVLLD